jgi:hypothetical protein
MLGSSSLDKKLQNGARQVAGFPKAGDFGNLAKLVIMRALCNAARRQELVDLTGRQSFPI